MQHSTTLSKSDFIVGSTCAKKLVYRKQGYPTVNEGNEYLEMLAEGGYVVGYMATLLYPEGIEIKGSTQKAVAQTNLLMQQENITLFEPAYMHGETLVRIDILEKKGNTLNLIEVKSKAYDPDEKEEKQLKSLNKYLDDVAYQYLVLSTLYPQAEINCFMLLPNKTKRTQIAEMAGWFSLEKANPKPEENNRFNKPTVVFKYENHLKKADFVGQLTTDGILSLLPVDTWVRARMEKIRNKTNLLLKVLKEGISAEDYQITKACRLCEFRAPNADKNGYAECLGNMAEHKEHIFDLYYGGSIGHYTKGYYFDELLSEGKFTFTDIDPERLKNKDNEFGARARRQLMQIEQTRLNEEWIAPELKEKIAGFAYPLHFVDFETYTGAIPFHEGMRPYEVVAFQWSCHTIEKPGATPKHSEWLHTHNSKALPNELPNVEFARSLMRHIGYSGTPFMWATHENTVLRAIYYQLEEFGVEDPELKQWLEYMVTDKAQKLKGQWVDMNKMTQDYYWHPLMKGKTSIKKVLPAIWSSFPELHKIPHFAQYAPSALENPVFDPYDTLIKNVQTYTQDEEDTDENASSVKGGTEAMRAYYRIRFDPTLKPRERREVQKALLNYCKLDTMAMAIIARHWGLY
ncbi:MAG: DUF2779 domain-containing protein [Luteibaculaceae bacterium]